MGCRSDINLVLLKALLLAKEEIGENKELDKAIAERIGLKTRDKSSRAEDPLTGFLLEMESMLGDQALGTEDKFHGVLDYLIQVASHKHGTLEYFILTIHPDRLASLTSRPWYYSCTPLIFVH